MENGIECWVLDGRMPETVKEWVKFYHNKFHCGSELTVGEALSKTVSVHNEWQGRGGCQLHEGINVPPHPLLCLAAWPPPWTIPTQTRHTLHGPETHPPAREASRLRNKHDTTLAVRHNKHKRNDRRTL